MTRRITILIVVSHLIPLFSVKADEVCDDVMRIAQELSAGNLPNDALPGGAHCGSEHLSGTSSYRCSWKFAKLAEAKPEYERMNASLASCFENRNELKSLRDKETAASRKFALTFSNGALIDIETLPLNSAFDLRMTSMTSPRDRTSNAATTPTTRNDGANRDVFRGSWSGELPCPGNQRENRGAISFRRSYFLDLAVTSTGNTPVGLISFKVLSSSDFRGNVTESEDYWIKQCPVTGVWSKDKKLIFGNQTCTHSVLDTTSIWVELRPVDSATMAVKHGFCGGGTMHEALLR